MIVKELINKLSKMPDGNKVIFVNTDAFVQGAYEVTEVEDLEDGTIVLDSDYEKNYWEVEE